MEHAGTSLGPAEAAFASGLHDQVIVVVWRGAPTRDAVARCARAYRTCLDRAEGAVAYLALVEENSGPPSLFDLRFIGGVMDGLERMEAVAVVLEGRDPWMPWAFEAASRIAATQSRMRPTKLCVEADEAVAWLVARRLHRAPDDVFRAGLSHAIEHVRAQLDSF